MRKWSVPPLLALCCAFAGFATLHAAEDPGAVFVQVFQTFKTGEKLESSGKTEDALQKYRFCVSALEQIQKQSPDYEPIVIAFRLKKSREAIARLQSSAQGTPMAMSSAPVPTPAFSRPAPVAPRPPMFSTSYRLPVPGEAPPPSPVVPSVSPRSSGGDFTDQIVQNGVVNALKDQLRRLQLQLNQEKLANENLGQRLLESTAREQMALTEVDRTKVQNVELKGQLEQANRSLDDAQHNGEATKAAMDKRIAGLEAELEAARADVEVANESNDELFTKLERAASFIDVSEKIRTSLLEQRKELSESRRVKPSDLEKLEWERTAEQEKNRSLVEKLADLEKTASQSKNLAEKVAAAEKQVLEVAKDRDARKETVERLTKEVAQLKEQRDASVAKTEALEQKLEDSTKLAEQNKQLETKLAAAEQEIATATKSREEREKIEKGLRAEVETVNRSLATMRDQLAAGGKRMVELEKQLSETSAATAATTGAMAEENALLKSLVSRQLAEQARRQQARKLVEEEMEKLQVRSTTLEEKLNAMAEAETALSPRERKLFENPVTGVPGGADFSLVVEKKAPTSDLPEDLSARAKEANDLAQQGRLGESRDIYEELVAKAPQSYFAAVNLGITERLLGDYPKAVTAFKRALDLKADDSFALTNLGGAQFRQGAIADSIDTLRKAVAADSQSYLAHYLLAMALNQNGDAEAARKEVGVALDLKPDYLPAVQLSGEIGAQPSVKERPPLGSGVPSR